MSQHGYSEQGVGVGAFVFDDRGRVPCHLCFVACPPVGHAPMTSRAKVFATYHSLIGR